MDDIYVVSMKTRDAQHFLDEIEKAGGNLVYMEVDKTHPAMTDAAVQVDLSKVEQYLTRVNVPHLIGDVYEWNAKEAAIA